MASLVSSNWFQSVEALLPTGSSPPPRDRSAVQMIREQADSLRRAPDSELVDRTSQLRRAVEDGIDPVSKDILLPGLALCHEAARRALGIDLYDVQLLGGLTLARGKIAEMQTGEGKTFVAALPAFIHGLTGKGAHVLTVNDYLARRDFELMGPVFQLLGMSAGFLQPASSPTEKRQAYLCDVTYGPGYEFGFDYLRDQAQLLARHKPRLGQRYRERLSGRSASATELMQRGFAFCVVDEVDSVLIDEATTPLVLSGGVGGSEPVNDRPYSIARETAARLTADHDYFIDKVAHRVCLTKQGLVKIADVGRQAAQHGLLRPWTVYVRQALQAQLLMNRDVHYIVDAEKIMLVDQNTGRVAPDRNWRDGLHQAIEVKEGLAPTPEQQPLGHITRQRFFALYRGMCGMTGTATGNESELKYFYGLPVVVIPPRKPSARRTRPTRYFADQKCKFAAITEELGRIHATKQPVLVGTRTIEMSELLAGRLQAAGIPFRLLNGKQDEEEAQIVAQSGQLGAITIATNMAGRGTDIKLGPGAREAGGLHVLGTEQHESARIDRQLIGRAARQGEPGSCQFFVAADDQLIRLHGPRLAERIARSAGEGGESRTDFSAEVTKLQHRVERLNFIQRQQMFAHDRWLEGVLATLAEA